MAVLLIGFRITRRRRNERVRTGGKYTSHYSLLDQTDTRHLRWKRVKPYHKVIIQSEKLFTFIQYKLIEFTYCMTTGTMTLLWFPMLIIAIINGTVREWYKKYTGHLAAHQISTITLIIFFGIYIFCTVRNYPPDSDKQALLIGIIWLLMTLIFEFGFGRYRGLSWTQLFSEYNLLKGKLWILIPIWVAMAPYLFFTVK